MKKGSIFLPARLFVFLAIFILPASLLANYYNNQYNPQPILIPGKLEVQFEVDIDPVELSTSLNRVSFGVAILDRSLERIDAYEARPLFAWRTGSDAVVGNNDMSRFFEILIPEDVDIYRAIDELKQNPYIRSVSAVYAMPVRVTPNDPGYAYQAALNLIDGPEAYDVEKGSDTVKIAIIDTGVLYSHPDLRDNIWVNPGEDIDNDMVVFDPDDSNLLDNDGNLLDDLIGWDFFTGFGGQLECLDPDCDTPDNNPIDHNGHGTHCAGIMAGISNNSYGMAGVAGGWGGGNGPFRGPRIMCLRVGATGRELTPPYNVGGWVNSINCAEALAYAADKDADVINCSWGMADTPAMRTALQAAVMNGAIVCHAAGNENITTGDFCDYWRPTWNNGEKVVISIAWTDNDDTKNYWSNYGEWVDICAPGTSVYSTWLSGTTPTFSWQSGSSMSTPFVGGVAALIKSHMPGYSRQEIVDLMLDNADEMWDEPLWYIYGQLGSGRINAYKCLDSLPTAAFQAGPILIGEAPLTVNFTDESPNTPISSWIWDFGDNDSSTTQNPSHTYYQYGLKTVSLTVEDEFGTGTEILKNLIMITADTIKLDSVAASKNGEIVYPIYLDNKYQAKSITLPFTIRESTGAIPSYITLDSVSTAGTRTDYFESLTDFSIAGNQIYGYKLTSDISGGSTYLIPDIGMILNLYLSVSGSVAENKLLVIQDTSLAGGDLEIESILYDYSPVFVPGRISIAVCTRGDANGDGDINIFDITFIIAYLYLDGPPPPDENCANVNADGNINIFDITYLIDYLYRDGPPPPP